MKNISKRQQNPGRSHSTFGFTKQANQTAVVSQTCKSHLTELKERITINTRNIHVADNQRELNRTEMLLFGDRAEILLGAQAAQLQLYEIRQ